MGSMEEAAEETQVSWVQLRHPCHPCAHCAGKWCNLREGGGAARCLGTRRVTTLHGTYVLQQRPSALLTSPPASGRGAVSATWRPRPRAPSVPSSTRWI